MRILSWSCLFLFVLSFTPLFAQDRHRGNRGGREEGSFGGPDLSKSGGDRSGPERDLRSAPSEEPQKAKEAEGNKRKSRRLSSQGGQAGERPGVSPRDRERPIGRSGDPGVSAGTAAPSSGPNRRERSGRKVLEAGSDRSGVHTAKQPEHRTTNAIVPERVRALGIKRVPETIHDRSRIMSTDRKHSTVLLPKEGPGGKVFASKVLAPKAMSGGAIKAHMASVVKNAAFVGQINIYNRNEMRANQYYWHHWNGIDYCHYYDTWGYHWYGWSIGSGFFWTRYYGDRWWWYDPAFDRWCYWHAGWWWWQDPFHVNLVYVYNNGDYTSCQNGDPAPVQGSGLDQTVYRSNDGTRKIKVMGDAKDAFLYDAAQDPSFEPLYLASGVKDVRFSDTSHDKPLQIILTLADGSFQMFDSYGNPYK